MPADEAPEPQKGSPNYAIGVGMGLPIGVALGTALDNLAMGIAIGLCLAAGLSFAFTAKPEKADGGDGTGFTD